MSLSLLHKNPVLVSWLTTLSSIIEKSLLLLLKDTCFAVLLEVLWQLLIYFSIFCITDSIPVHQNCLQLYFLSHVFCGWDPFQQKCSWDNKIPCYWHFTASGKESRNKAKNLQHLSSGEGPGEKPGWVWWWLLPLSIHWLFMWLFPLLIHWLFTWILPLFIHIHLKSLNSIYELPVIYQALFLGLWFFFIPV